MSQIETILGRNINSIKELKSAIKDLQDSLVGLDKESDEYKQTAQQLIAAQDELKNATRAGIEANLAEKDSLIGLKNEYKELYNTYKQLTEAERNSPLGKDMAASLEALSNKINDTQKGIGDWHANIGRYAESAGEAFNGMGLSIGGLQTPLKLATGGAKTFGTALKSLAANPIVLVITALVAILAKAAEAIKKNEQLSNRLNQALAALKPVTDALANVFDFLAGMIVKAVEGMSKAVEWISKISPKWNAAVKSHKELAKATNDLTKAQRENSVVASQKTAEIERLRQEASATDDVVEKKRLLEEAKKMQQEVDQREIELAQEELRILQEYADKTANSAEDNEKLAAAQKKVNDAIAKGEQNMRQYNKQLNTVDNSVKKTTTSTKNYREEAKKLHEQLIEDNKDEITKITEKYEKEKKLLTKYGYDTTLLTQKYENDVYKVRKKAYDDWYAAWNEGREKTAKMQAELGMKVDPVKQLEEDLKKLKTTTHDTAVGLTQDGEIIKKALDKATDIDAYPVINAIRLLQKVDADFYSNATNLDYYIEKLESLAELPTPNTAITVTQETIKETIEGLKKFGGEKLGELMQDVEKAAKDLSKNGFPTENASQAKTTVDNITQAVKELNGQISQLKIEISGKTETENFLNELLSMDTSLFNYEDIVKFQEQGERKILEAQKKAYEEELRDFKGTKDQKLEMMQQYYNIAQQLRQKDWEATQALSNLQKERMSEMVESLIDWTDKMGSAINTYRSSQEALIDSEVKAGYISEKEGNKKKKRLLALQRAERDFSIATITADAAAGIFSIWKGYATEVGTINPQTAAAAGPGAAAALGALNTKSLITAVAKTASLASTAAAQIAAAQNGYITAKNNMTAEEAAASPSVAATPTLIDSTPYSYARTIQTTEEEAELNRPVWVSVEDISSALGRQVVVRDESSF